MRTQCNLPGARDIEASDNRVLALNWLYAIDGRDDSGHPLHDSYTGLWQAFQEALENIEPDV